MKTGYLWYGRFVGVANLMYGLALVISTGVNLATGAEYDSPWIVALILFVGVAGSIGSLLFLLSIDGPERFRARPLRRMGWIVMFGAVLLPSTISFFLAPLTLVSIGMAFLQPEDPVLDQEGSPTTG